MKVLIGCEFSGIVRDAFLERGHDALSCDLEPTEKLGPHYQGDLRDLLNESWDLMIAHPPCTRICRNAHRWNNGKEIDVDLGYKFFLQVKNANIPRICIENPLPSNDSKQIMGQYSQIIQPWQYGHDYSKKTCLWLKNLPKLVPTKIVDITYYITPKGRKFTAGWYKTPRNGKDRSRFFTGIAEAMADQWGCLKHSDKFEPYNIWECGLDEKDSCRV